MDLVDLDPDPIVTLRDWLREAEHTPLSEAMTLATAFLVTSETARVLALQTPGTGEAFYRDAGEPVNRRRTPHGRLTGHDYARVAEQSPS